MVSLEVQEPVWDTHVLHRMLGLHLWLSFSGMQTLGGNGDDSDTWALALPPQVTDWGPST